MEQGGRPMRSVILTSWRSGSTFLGDVVNAHPANFYHYEPLLDYGIVQIRGPPLADESLTKIISLLKCEFKELGEEAINSALYQFIFAWGRRSCCMTNDRMQLYLLQIGILTTEKPILGFSITTHTYGDSARRINVSVGIRVLYPSFADCFPSSRWSLCGWGCARRSGCWPKKSKESILRTRRALIFREIIKRKHI